MPFAWSWIGAAAAAVQDVNLLPRDLWSRKRFQLFAQVRGTKDALSAQDRARDSMLASAPENSTPIATLLIQLRVLEAGDDLSRSRSSAKGMIVVPISAPRRCRRSAAMDGALVTTMSRICHSQSRPESFIWR